MRPNRTITAAVAVVAQITLWVTAAGAQSRPDPADPAARVPAAAYRSPFADYRPLGDEAVGNWRAANDEVGRIGGWREYAREAQESAPASGAPGVPAPKSAPAPDKKGGHEGHPHHGKKL
jgi:hypothetical protein